MLLTSASGVIAQVTLPLSGPITIQQIADYMYGIGELTLAEKNGSKSIVFLNGKSRLVDKTLPFSLSDWYGYWTCGSNFKITHIAGTTAPVTKEIIYGSVLTSVSGASKCWITQNLGADHSAVSVNDPTEASGGWYWQFNRSRGYKIGEDGVRFPTSWFTSINETGDWVQANDPCYLLLGPGWRLPTNSEWITVGANASYGNPTLSYNSELKLHGAGWIDQTGSPLRSRGTNLSIWSQSGTSLTTAYETSDQGGHNPTFFEILRTYGLPLRCLKD